MICIFHSHILVCLLQAQRYVLLVYHHHVLMKYKISSDVGPIFGNSTQTLFIPLNLQFSQVCSKVTEIRTSKFRTNLFTSLCLSACFQRTRMPHPQNILCHTHQTYYATSRGVTRLDSAQGKKQVWSPHVRAWGLSEANVVYSRKYLWHCWDFSAPRADIQRPSQ